MNPGMIGAAKAFFLDNLKQQQEGSFASRNLLLSGGMLSGVGTS